MANEATSPNPKVTVVATADFWDHHNGLQRKTDQEFVLRQSVAVEYEKDGLVKQVAQTEKPQVKRGRAKNTKAGPANKKDK